MCLDREESEVCLDVEALGVDLGMACFQLQGGPRCQCFLEMDL